MKGPGLPLKESSSTLKKTGAKKDWKDSRPSEERRVISGLLTREAYELQRQELGVVLHDHIGQPLTALKFIVSQLKGPRTEENASLTEEAAVLVDDMLVQVRSLLVKLQPNSLHIDFQLALKSLLARHNQYTRMQARLDDSKLTADVSVPAGVTQAILSIVQEALTNAGLHAGASETAVRVWNTRSHISVVIESAGAGFDPDDIAFSCFGLTNAYGTACLAQGKLTIESVPGAGTRVTARFPLAK